MSSEGLCPVFTHMDIKRCSGCEACVNVCPTGVLQMKDDGTGYRYPVLDEEQCIHCDKCVKTCPIYNTEPRLNANEKYYAAYSKDTDAVLKSASGGLFSFIVQEFEKRYPDGYVAGAVYSDDFRSVVHILTNDMDEIVRMRSSKYYQSFKGDIYKKCAELLKEGNAVFFTGSPCETSALRYVIGNKSYDNLWTLDYICKGSCSPKILSDYVDMHEKKQNSRVTYLNMRHKWSELDNWIPQFLKLEFSNGHKILKEFYNTELGIGFHILQRKSCPYCPYREKEHHADFTIGDNHSVHDGDKLYNRLGSSVIVINTDHGTRLWESFDKSGLAYGEVGKSVVYDNNRNPVDPRNVGVRERLKTVDGVTAVREALTKKERMKMHMPVKLLRRITVYRRNRKR